MTTAGASEGTNAAGVDESVPTGSRRRQPPFLRLMNVVLPVFFASLVVAFWAGTQHGRWVSSRKPAFHKLLVNHPEEYVKLVDPRDPAVRLLAKNLDSLEQAYLWVRDNIAFDPSAAAEKPGTMLGERRASCMGKAVILASLYRAMGLPSESVRVVTGEVGNEEFLTEHAWVELEHRGHCFAQDTTPLLGDFEFGDFPDDSYRATFVRRENYCFNDRGFAVISQLNRMRSHRGMLPAGP